MNESIWVCRGFQEFFVQYCREFWLQNISQAWIVDDGIKEYRMGIWNLHIEASKMQKR